jgi:hypothetical protein
MSGVNLPLDQLEQDCLTRAWSRRGNPRGSGLGVCAGHGTARAGCKSPGQIVAESKARRRPGRHREVGSQGSRSPQMRGDAQAPERRGGTPGTSGHATTQSALRGGVCLIHPAFRHRQCCVFLRAVGLVSQATGWLKSRGTAGKPGGNSATTPPPAAVSRPARGRAPL